MSVIVRIDGQPANQSEAYRHILHVLGPDPDESHDSFDLWTTAPRSVGTFRSVWLNPESKIALQDWLQAGGVILESRMISGRTEDRLRQAGRDVRTGSDVEPQLDPAVLAACPTGTAAA